MEEKKEDGLHQAGQPIKIELPDEMVASKEAKKENVEPEALPKSEEAKTKKEKDFPYQTLPLEKKKGPTPPLYVTLLIISIILFIFSALIFSMVMLNWPVPGFIRTLLGIAK